MYRQLFAGIAPAPPVELEYLNSLFEKVLLAARQAAKKMQPVTVEICRGESKIGINRRGHDKNGHPGILPNPRGPFDDQVWVLKLSHPDRRLAAVVFSHACHPVLVYGMAHAAISADFPGAARQALRDKLGADTHVQFVQGLAGDIRPRVVADVDQNRWRTAKLEDVQRAGAELAGGVLAALKSPRESLTLNLAGSMDRPFLPRAEPPDRGLYERMAAGTNQFQRAVARYWLNRYETGEGFAKGDSWPLGLIRLADNQWICYLAGEPCVEWGDKIRQWLAPRRVAVWGYCQEAISYLPTEELLPEGGYEVVQSNYNRATTPAKFAPGIQEALRKSLLRQAASLEAIVN